MEATKRGSIGATIGAFGMVSLVILNGQADIKLIIGYIVLGMLYGFGLAFGWKYMKTITSKLLGVATGVSIITILTSKQDTLLKIFFIYMFAFSLGIAVSWIPGIVVGTKQVLEEHGKI